VTRYLIGAAGFAVAVAIGLAASSLLPDHGQQAATAAVAQPAPTVPAGEDGPIIREAQQADLDLSMVIEPGYAGDNDLNFFMIDVDRDWKDVERFSARFTYLDGKIERSYDLTQLHEGHFPLEHLDLPLAGRWHVDVSVVRAEVGETRFNFDFVLSHQ
jgi:hypothetical protein